jgi:hypothetical protein
LSLPTSGSGSGSGVDWIDEQVLDLIERRVDLDVRVEESRMDGGPATR